MTKVIHRNYFMTMTNNKSHWENIHKTGISTRSIQNHTSFAEESAEYLKKPSSILELGCGVCNDAIYFASKGHTVLATDFSENVIQKNKRELSHIQNVSFSVLNITNVDSIHEQFDLVYAHLSLHYFTDSETRSIFKKMHARLNSNGLLAFICKSVHDPLYGKGTQLESDMYELNKHMRHFFSVTYVRNLLEDSFVPVKLEEDTGEFYGSESEFVKVIARKK
jgi:SAM-dependent methyltransferase